MAIDAAVHFENRCQFRECLDCFLCLVFAQRTDRGRDRPRLAPARSARGPPTRRAVLMTAIRAMRQNFTRNSLPLLQAELCAKLVHSFLSPCGCVRLDFRGRVAQLVEQCPFKAWVLGSSPSALTISTLTASRPQNPTTSSSWLKAARKLGSRGRLGRNRGRTCFCAVLPARRKWER